MLNFMVVHVSAAERERALQWPACLTIVSYLTAVGPAGPCPKHATRVCVLKAHGGLLTALSILLDKSGSNNDAAVG